jgi:glycogen debranching enzyme
MRDEAPKLRHRAETLAEQFNREFWMEDKKFYAMALDGHHRHVDCITSNPGECLWSRIVDAGRVPDIAGRLLGPSMFSGWGIRSMASGELAYNPFSYHDGSVWPFDNAIIASGLKKYGFIDETQQVFNGLLDASLYFEYRRWPEVYCGVGKTVGGVLARQPDASRPQAWSAGAIFSLLQTLVGIAPRPFSNFVDVTPALPAGLDEIVVENMSISGGTLSLRLVRENNAVLIEIIDNPNDLDIVIHPASRGHYHPHGKDKPAVSQ